MINKTKVRLSVPVAVLSLSTLVACATTGGITWSPSTAQEAEPDYQAGQSYQQALRESNERARQREELIKKLDAENQQREAVEKEELLKQHRANNGLLVKTVGPACLTQPSGAAVLGAQNPIELAAVSQCMVFSSTEAEVKLSFLNDGKNQAKDIRVQCVLVAESGTSLGKAVSKTIYQLWQPGEIKAFTIKLPIQDQMKSAACKRLG